jgi:AcrR family transcriptional regulator
VNKSERTKNYIVEAASPIFNKKGYAGTSISDILAGTGLTKGSIYGNFKNKDELAVAALEYNFNRAAKSIYFSVNSKGNACDRLIVFVESFRRYYDIIMHYGGCPVMNAAVDSDDGNPLIKKKVIKFIKLWKQSIASIIKDGKKQKEITGDSNAGDISMLFISIIEGSLMLSKATGEKKYIENAIDHIVSQIERMRTE